MDKLDGERQSAACRLLPFLSPPGKPLRASHVSRRDGWGNQNNGATRSLRHTGVGYQAKAGRIQFAPFPHPRSTSIRDLGGLCRTRPLRERYDLPVNSSNFSCAHRCITRCGTPFEFSLLAFLSPLSLIPESWSCTGSFLAMSKRLDHHLKSN